MRIIHISPVFLPYHSGMTNVVYNQTKELGKRGHQVEVLTLHYDKSWSGEETIDGIQIHRIKPLIKYGNAGFAPRIGNWLKQTLRQAQGDYYIIHLHTPFFGGQEIISLMRQFGTLKNVKLIVQYHHDPQLNIFTKILSLPSSLTFKSLIKSADKVIVSSMDYAQNSNIKDLISERFMAIPLGVDHNRFKPANKKPKTNSKGDVKVLFLGALDRAHHFKGLDILLQAFKKVQAGQMLNVNRQMLIIGTGDLLDYYRRLAKQLQLDKQVNFLGFVTDKDLPQIYQTANLFVFPSTGKAEAFGLVVLEAMSSGLPVLASDLPGVRALIQNKDFLVQPRSIAKLAKKLETLLNNKELLAKTGQANRQLVEEKYTWQKSVDKLERIYKDLK
jgi:glycosyltransferase involved in cell wall biosynthesis